MKRLIQKQLQKLLGFESYLKFFAGFKIYTLAFDKKERDFFTFLHLLPKEGSVIDAGANVGIMTYYLSKRSPGLTIHAFEPVPPNFSALSWVVRRFGLSNVKLHALALGSSAGKVSIVIPNENGVKMQGLSHVAQPGQTTSEDQFEVNVVQLDQMIPAEEKVAGIKLDVENYETEVLLGADEILTRDHPLIYAELWDNENRVTSMEFLNRHGYEIFRIERGKLVPWFPSDPGQNFIFIWKGKA